MRDSGSLGEVAANRRTREKSCFWDLVQRDTSQGSTERQAGAMSLCHPQVCAHSAGVPRAVDLESQQGGEKNVSLESGPVLARQWQSSP